MIPNEKNPKPLYLEMASLRHRSIELLEASREPGPKIEVLEEKIGKYQQLVAEMRDALLQSEEITQRFTIENEVLVEIGRIIGSKLTTQEVFEQVFLSAKKALCFDQIMIHVLQSDRKNFSLQYAEGLRDNDCRIGDIIPAADLVPEEALPKLIACLPSNEKPGDTIPPFPQSPGPLPIGFRSVIRIPLVTMDQWIGILSLLSKNPGVYGARDLRFARNIGILISETMNRTPNSNIRPSDGEALLQSAEHTLGMGPEPTRLDRIQSIFNSTFAISEIYERFAEKKMKESEEQYRWLFENIPLGIVSADLNGNIIEVNPVFLEMLNFPSKEAVMATNILSFQPLVDAGISSDFHSCLETGQRGIFERKLAGPWKERKYLRYHISPLLREDQVVGVQAVLEDISEQKRLEAQLLQSQKMEAIGTLAGGIAHDFNNMLGAIMGYTELVALEIPPGTKTMQNLCNSIKAAKRAKDLVQQILAFSRQSEPEKKPMEVGPTLKDSLNLIRSSLPATIEIQQFIEPDPGIIQGNPAQIHQIILNLCMNGAQAMEAEGGVLSVHLQKIEVDNKTADLQRDLKPGSYLRLKVTDSGHGIPREIRGKIFDPYFTTKEVGKGTGLGLAVVHGIVKSHGGAIRVESELGRGTTFVIFLPLIRSAKLSETASPEMALPMGNKERILLVEDELALAGVEVQMLEHLGYEVEVRMNGLEAWELFKTKPERYDLVITDMTMPKMTGDRLTEEILRLRKDMPVILCTGYSERIMEQRAKGLGIREYLLKPIEIGELARAIRKALEPDKKQE